MTTAGNVRQLSFDGGETLYIIEDEIARTSIGDLSELSTDSKTDLVTAINEINQGLVIDAELNESSTNAVQNATITTAFSLKQDILTAGTGISISEGIISATGGVATWGEVIGELSEQADLVEALGLKQDTLIAGAGISISDEGVISNTQTSAEWGNISGTLSEQTDLQTVLDSKQDSSLMVTTIDSSSTDETYPSAKSVYDIVANAEYQLDVLSDHDEDLILVGTNQYDPGNFLLKGTIINVELDESGDFTTLQDALTYLNGKWSNGEITIQLGEGIFNETLFKIVGKNFNIPQINIYGKGTNLTTLKFQITTAYEFGMYIDASSYVYFKDLTLTCLGDGKANNYRGICVTDTAKATFRSVNITNLYEGICAANNGEICLAGTVTISDCTTFAIAASNGHICSGWNTALTATNVVTLFSVVYGGFISCHQTVYTGTNVTNKTSQTKGSITNDGYISIPF